MTATESTIKWGQPYWTAPMFQPKTGMDHLGLASASQDQILRDLSPGINVLTIHPRYWSVYSWLLTEFWERDLPRTHAAWGRFLKPRERVFVAAVLRCPRHGAAMPQVGGKDRIGKELDSGVTSVDPRAAYLKNSRGGYPIYAAAMAQLGLSILDRDTEQFRCDAPTERGRSLGRVMSDWLSDTDYYQVYFEETDTPVPLDAIDEFSEMICLCRLTQGPDHPFVQDALLHGGSVNEAAARRASLRMICDLSDQTASTPIGSWAFRQLIYYRADSDEGSFLPADPEILRTVRRWRLYQHREYLAWGFNRWLQSICEWGLDQDGDRSPISFADVLATVKSADFSALAEALGTEDPGLTSDDPLEALIQWLRTEANVSGELDDSWDIDAAVSEDRILDELWDLSEFGDHVTAGILGLLSLCASRLWSREHELKFSADWSLVRAGGARRLSVQRFLNDMRNQVKQGATIAEAGAWFLEHYVLRQHHRVAMGKLPDDTFRLRLDAGRVGFRNESVAVQMNDSRYLALSTCASELGWTGPMQEPGHTLTQLGHQFVTTGDLPSLDHDVVGG